MAAPQPRPRTTAKFFGKYRGKVVDNLDPLFQGRILADVPALHQTLTNYALPCTPYAGANVGFYAIPPIGANVWIEFEAGDPNYPIWAGCFWGPEDVLQIPQPPTPFTKVFKTDSITMVLNDTPAAGGFSLQCSQTAVDMPISLTFDATGITITAPQSSIKLTPASVQATVEQSALTLTPDSITLTVPQSAIELSSRLITLATSTSSIDLTSASIDVAASGINLAGAVLTSDPEQNPTQTNPSHPQNIAPTNIDPPAHSV